MFKINTVNSHPFEVLNPIEWCLNFLRFYSDIVSGMHCMRIFSRFRSSWFVLPTAHRSTSIHDFLCNIFSAGMYFHLLTIILCISMGKWNIYETKIGILCDKLISVLTFFCLCEKLFENSFSFCTFVLSFFS